MADAFNISTFSSQIVKTGIANPAYFIVRVNLPGGMGDTQPLSFRIEQASLPTRNVLTHDQRYYGPSRKIPYGYVSQDFQITVILSEDMRERELFMNWQDIMLGNSRTKSRTPLDNKPEGMFDVGYYDTAVKNASIELLTYATKQPGVKSGPLSTIKEIAESVGFNPSVFTNPLGFDPFGLSGQTRNISESYTIKLIEPFPLSINEVPLSWADDGYARLQVQFSYRYFTEDHRYFDGSSSDGGIASMFRGGLNMFNKFKPILSLIRGQGLGGAVRSVAGQVGGDALGNIKSIFKF